MSVNDLKYEKIPKGTQRYEYLSKAVPYGGHLEPTKLRPPLYEVKPDVLIVSDDFELLLCALLKYLKKGKSVYFHPVIRDGFLSQSNDRLCSLMSQLFTLSSDVRTHSLMLPPNASLFKVENELLGEVSTHYTQLFDYGDSDKSALKDPRVVHYMHFISLMFREEKMIWFNELPGSWISPLWSKRIITPHLTHWIVNDEK